MASIIKRTGDLAKVTKASNNVADFGVLKAEYRSAKKKVSDCDEKFENEKSKLARVAEELNMMVDKLNGAQEVIDCDPLPEGAQPRERIQIRDKFKLVSLNINLIFYCVLVMNLFLIRCNSMSLNCKWRRPRRQERRRWLLMS